MAIQQGVDAKTVSSILGHYSAGFTLDTYTHVTNEMRKKLALCREIQTNLPRMERVIQKIETKDEVIRDEHRRR